MTLGLGLSSSAEVHKVSVTLIVPISSAGAIKTTVTDDGSNLILEVWLALKVAGVQEVDSGSAVIISTDSTNSAYSAKSTDSTQCTYLAVAIQLVDVLVSTSVST